MDEVEPTKAYYDNDPNVEDVHPNFVANAIAKIDEIDLEINIGYNISISKLEKAKLWPRLEHNTFQESFAKEKAKEQIWPKKQRSLAILGHNFSNC